MSREPAPENSNQAKEDPLVAFSDQLQGLVVEQARRIINLNLYTKSLLSALPVVLLATYQRGYIRTLNHAAEEILGLSEEHLRGRLLTDVFLSNPEITDKVMRTLNEGHHFHMGSESVCLASGKELIGNLYLQPLRDEEQAICGLLLTVEDQTYVHFLHDAFRHYVPPSVSEMIAQDPQQLELGADLYDFFFVDESHLCFAIGDVAGKGVPASLFMAITMTLLKTRATKGMTPDRVVARVNQDLSLDNPSLTFVTLFLGIINIHTGELDYCNAGHIPPYLIPENGDIEALEKTGGLVLGIAGDFEFSSKRIVLDEGDKLFLYTDGITESTNKAREFFSEKRLEKALALFKDKSIREVSSGVINEVKDFYQGEPQADDITIMILKYLSHSRS
jgi:PAS domain S-box-containing protein